jgi:N utilization substance protein A
MAEDLLQSIKQISRERGINPEIFFSAIKEALLTVSKKFFDPNASIQIEIDENKGIIEVYVSKLVVKEVSDPLAEIHWKDALKYDSKAREGDVIKIHMPGETLGRIAAQSAKQIIMQKILKAEQENIYEKYFPLAGTLMTGEIRRIENNNIILGLEWGEAVLPPKELSPKDSFRRGEIIKFLIKRVFSEGKGPLVLATRYMNDVVAELIKKEVPEVAEGIVKIFAISREPGIKSKVAVYSTDKAIDPVGAIVGMNGNRVLAITKELRGERIDVIAWSSAPERFIASALTPAEVVKVHLVDPENRVAEVTVKDETLSAAIGKKGVNIKLASKLTEWDIQIANRKNESSEEQQTKP